MDQTKSMGDNIKASESTYCRYSSNSQPGAKRLVSSYEIVDLR